jgi:hypothetical protein
MCKCKETQIASVTTSRIMRGISFFYAALQAVAVVVIMVNMIRGRKS